MHDKVAQHIRALQDTNADVRWKAAQALGGLNDPRAVEPLIHALQDTDTNVRWIAAQALGNLNDPRAVEPLIHALQDTDDTIRWSAANAFIGTHDPRAVEPLIHALQDSYSSMRHAAVFALRWHEDPRAVEPLIRALQDANANVRDAAATTLDALGGKERLLAEAEAKHRAEEARLRAEAEAKRRAEEAEAKRRAEEEARLRAEAEAKRRAEEAEAKRRAEEEARLRAEAEAKRRAEEARLRAEAEARRRAEEEARRAEEARLRAEAETKRRAEEEEARLRAEAEAKRRAEEETRLRAEAEAKRRRQAEARARLQREQNQLAGVAADLQQRLAPLQRFLTPDELQRVPEGLASCAEKLRLILLPPATELTPEAEGQLSQVLDGVSQGVRELSNDVERLALLAASRQAEEEARRAEEEGIRQDATTLVQQRSRLQRPGGRAQAQRLWPLVERQAEEAESRGDFALAETLFSQVDVLRQAAAETVPSTETAGQPPQPVSPQEPAAAFRDNLFALAAVLRESPDFSLDHAFLCALQAAPESARSALEDIWKTHFLAKQDMGKIALIQGRMPEFLALMEARFGLAQTAVQELRRLPSVTADDLLRVLDRTSGEEAEALARRREAIHTQVRRTVQQARTGFPPQLFSVFEHPVPLLGGVGGFAVVFRAYHRSLAREVAVKVPAERTPEAGRIFINEASLWADLHHPHIVEVVDHSAFPFPFLAMEYMAGGDLQRRLADRGSPFAVAEACRVLLQIAGAVRYAHEERDLIHGDIKASNILVGADGTPKLADWGLSRRSRALSRLMPAYSPEYAAPEQLRNERRSFKTDVYHLGGVLYHLTTGKAPYDGADSEEQLRTRVLSQPPPMPSQADPSLSPLDDLTARCMAKDPAQRPTIAQLCDALAGLGG